MKLMKSLLVVVFASFFLLSCNGNKNDSEKKESVAVSIKHIEYYTNGQRKFLSEEKKGMNDGIFYRWSKNGRIKTKGQYKKGKRVGKWEWFDNKGITCMKICYQL